MATPQAAARHQQRVEALCAGAIRALCGDPALHFRGRRLHRGQRALPLFAPHLAPSLEQDDFASFRGAADGMALRLAHSDAALHAALSPAEPLPRLLFEMLEQLRCEALAAPQLPGLLSNLRHRHAQWSLAFHDSGLTETATGILLYTVAQVCRARVTAEPVHEATEDLIEATRMALVPRLGHALAGLRRSRFEQAAYARHALAIADAVSGMIREAGQEAGAAPGEQAPEAGRPRRRQGFSLWPDLEGGDGGGIATVHSADSRVLAEAEDGYRVYTRAYDCELPAASLVRAALLREYRERLDRRIAGQGLNLARLARELKASLALPRREGWEGGQEAGHIDGRRLPQLIVSPSERRLFRIERQDPAAEGVVSFLIDCSGSMKQHVESVALLVDVFVRALEQAGLASEVLGFTTRAWNGGRAQRDWLRAGRPSHPGRLNEACHLVFKHADQPWRRARPGIAALLKADLFREGIDGEAVDWACARLAARGEPRKWLVVVSDGCPMDSATQLANDAHYLDQHLREVVARREAETGIAICGLGVGLDLSPYYRRNLAIDLQAPVDNVLLGRLAAILARCRPSYSA
ncbi:cobalt chelatase [Ramlibacter sp. 2FC]|uniref:cobaltochelatase CobT-related protein n=1 Tax=Ramlibacter sp. 2FC TaxID=2502188 RepID=UPI0010F8E3FE|nr:cobalt chelatase [Ramlibacter sp. 2FC]